MPIDNKTMGIVLYIIEENFLFLCLNKAYSIKKLLYFAAKI